MERLPNSQIQAMLRKAKADEGLTKAIKSGKGKELAKENDRAEKIAGGKRKIEQADKVLADAHIEAEEVVGKAKADGVILSRAAADEIKAGTAALDERRGNLDTLQTSLDGQRKNQALKSQELEDAATVLEDRKTAADTRDGTLDRRESEVGRREKDATIREAEIKRFDDWRAAAPA